jgi:hypothetical protein
MKLDFLIQLSSDSTLPIAGLQYMQKYGYLLPYFNFHVLMQMVSTAG